MMVICVGKCTNKLCIHKQAHEYNGAGCEIGTCRHADQGIAGECKRVELIPPELFEFDEKE